MRKAFAVRPPIAPLRSSRRKDVITLEGSARTVRPYRDPRRPIV